MEKQYLILIVIVALVIGFLTGRMIQTGYDEYEDHHNHNHHLPHPHQHSHEVLEITLSEAPSISLEVHEDEKEGWNLHISTENFIFNPEGTNADHVQGEGHAHLYIDGDKITRLYGHHYYIPSDWLTSGEHEIKVTLNSNDHRDLSLDGEIISSQKTIVKV